MEGSSDIGAETKRGELCKEYITKKMSLFGKVSISVWKELSRFRLMVPVRS